VTNAVVVMAARILRSTRGHVNCYVVKPSKYLLEGPRFFWACRTGNKSFPLLASVALIYRETSKNKPKSKDPSLELLAKFEEEEMLAPFVLLTHADEGIAEDYSAYREAHRDKLIAFLDRYLVPPAP